MYRLLIFLWFTACQEASKPSTMGLSIATDEYIVLAEKALTYQADGNWDAWADMLAPSVCYYLPDQPQPLRGKAAVLGYFKAQSTRNPVQSVHINRLMHLPVQRSTASGDDVYVVSFYRSELRYADGHSIRRRYNVCCHFDEAKLIDRLECFQSPELIANMVNY